MGEGVDTPRQGGGLALEDAAGATAASGEDLGHLAPGTGQINCHILSGAEKECTLLAFAGCQ